MHGTNVKKILAYKIHRLYFSTRLSVYLLKVQLTHQFSGGERNREVNNRRSMQKDKRMKEKWGEKYLKEENGRR